MAASAISALAMGCKALPHGEVLRSLLLMFQGWHIRRRGLGRIIEDHPCDPSPARNGLGLIRAGGHRHHRRIGNYPPMPLIGDRLTLEVQGHRPAQPLLGRFPVPLAQARRPVGVIRVDKLKDRAILNQHRLKQQERLHHHVHAGPVIGRSVIEIPIDRFIRKR